MRLRPLVLVALSVGFAACTPPTPPSTASAPSAAGSGAPSSAASSEASSAPASVATAPVATTAATDTCAAKGGVCSSGAQCNGPAAGRYIDYATIGDGSCGSVSAGMVCCVACAVAADSPDSCCGVSYGAVTVCVNGKVGCMPGQTGIAKGQKCPWEK